MKDFHFLYPIIFVGLPTTTALSRTSLVTTGSAPIIALFPITIYPKQQTLTPKSTLFNIVGTSKDLSVAFVPIVVSYLKAQPFPINLALILAPKR